MRAAAPPPPPSRRPLPKAVQLTGGLVVLLPPAKGLSLPHCWGGAYREVVGVDGQAGRLGCEEEGVEEEKGAGWPKVVNALGALAGAGCGLVL